MFFFLPMILLFVYPFSWFQRILNNISLNSLTLRTFVEVFQGPFKDGTNNGRDCRCFSGLLLLSPLIQILIFTLTQQSSFYYLIAGIWLLLYLSLNLVFSPYKRPAHNYVTMTMLLALLLVYWGLSMHAAITTIPSGNFNDEFNFYRDILTVSLVLVGASICVVVLYPFCLILFTCVSHNNLY